MQDQQHPQYTIQTVGDFLKVPEDRLDACMEMANDLADHIGGDKSQNAVKGFDWIDDGEKNVTIRISPNEA